MSGLETGGSPLGSGGVPLATGGSSLASGGAPAGGGGSLATTGGTTATGGAPTGGAATGGAASGGTSTGGAASGGGTSTGGAASGGGTATGGSTSTGGSSTGGAANADCGAGTKVASAPPTVITWEGQNGKGAVSLSSSPYQITVPSGATADPYVAAILSTWTASSRECIDVSAFTGVQFDLTANLAPGKTLYLKVLQSEADPSGSCTAGANCYANPYKIVTSGVAVKVPFSSLSEAGWGVNAPFNSKEVLGFTWATDDRTAGSTISVSNLTLY